MSGWVRYSIPRWSYLHGVTPRPVDGVDDGGRCLIESAASQICCPPISGDNDLCRRLDRLFWIFVEDPVFDSEIAVLVSDVAIESPEAVLLLGSQYSLRCMQAHIGEGHPDRIAVAGDRVVEAAVSQQPEVGHVRLGIRWYAVGRPGDGTAAHQVRRDRVQRFEHRQASQACSDATCSRSPRRMLMECRRDVTADCCGDEGREERLLEMRQVLMIGYERFRRATVCIRGRTSASPSASSGCFSRTGMLVVRRKQHLDRLARQEPAILRALAHPAPE